MTKSELRKSYKLLRLKLSPQDIEDLSLEIANKLLKLPIWDYSYYHTFLSIKELNEVNSEYILNILAGKDKNIVISKTDFKHVAMINYLLTDATIIKKSAYNIPEPIDGVEVPNKKIEVIFIPLLAFDKQGNRVGYGKGFYDIFLSQCDPNAVKIGVSFYEAETKIEIINPKDVPLDYCVTPATIYRF
jgi:5-formyltetrahydrofolate cyclo-ligase